jgi:hypothetical protein
MRKEDRNKWILQRLREKANRFRSPFHQLGWLENISIIVSLWFLLFPFPYKILFSIVVTLPIIGLSLNFIFSRRYLKITNRPSIFSLVRAYGRVEGRDKYMMVDYVQFPAIVLMIRFLLDFQFESVKVMIIKGFIAFIIVFIFLFSTHRIFFYLETNKKWIYITVFANIILFSFSGTYCANCVYDHAKPAIYETYVISKKEYISARRHRIHLSIEVPSWLNKDDTKYVEITRKQYNKIQIGQKVKIDLQEGLFKIPWYHLHKEDLRYNDF